MRPKPAHAQSQFWDIILSLITDWLNIVILGANIISVPKIATCSCIPIVAIFETMFKRHYINLNMPNDISRQ